MSYFDIKRLNYICYCIRYKAYLGELIKISFAALKPLIKGMSSVRYVLVTDTDM